MMSYTKPNKQERNENYLRAIGFNLDENPYEEKKELKAKLFLIVCEGLNTEPEYFKGFPVPTNVVVTAGEWGQRHRL